MKLKLTLLMTLYIAALSGCMATRVDLRETGALQVKLDVPEGVSLSAVPYESEGELIVLGQVSRSPLSAVNVNGHVDIKIINPRGEMVAEWQVHLKRLPAGRHLSHPGSFSFSIPGVPPHGSIVEVKYDNRSHDHSENSSSYKSN